VRIGLGRDFRRRIAEAIVPRGRRILAHGVVLLAFDDATVEAA